MAAAQVRAVVLDMRDNPAMSPPREHAWQVRAVVLDMRDNPGGLLEAAVAVSTQLVPQGTEIVSTAGRWRYESSVCSAMAWPMKHCELASSENSV